MRVSGTPQRPNPPAKRVVFPFMFSRAAEAEGRILLISFRESVVEKARVWREDWDERSAPSSMKSMNSQGVEEKLPAGRGLFGRP